MPVATVEQLRKKEASLEAELAKSKDTLEQDKLRALKKQIRRTQRKRRRLVVAEEKRAAQQPKQAESDAAGSEEKSE